MEAVGSNCGNADEWPFPEFLRPTGPFSGLRNKRIYDKIICGSGGIPDAGRGRDGGRAGSNARAPREILGQTGNHGDACAKHETRTETRYFVSLPSGDAMISGAAETTCTPYEYNRSFKETCREWLFDDADALDLARQ